MYIIRYVLASAADSPIYSRTRYLRVTLRDSVLVEHHESTELQEI
jgi:hypothetical protein